MELQQTRAKLKEQIGKDHQKRLAKLNYDKAKAERDQALVSTTTNTAVAIAKKIAAAGFCAALPTIAGDVAIGLVQAAVVLSKPLPQYSPSSASVASSCTASSKRATGWPRA